MKPDKVMDGTEDTYENFLERVCSSTCEFGQSLKTGSNLDESNRETFCKFHLEIYDFYKLNQNIIALSNSAGYPTK